MTERQKPSAIYNYDTQQLIARMCTSALLFVLDVVDNPLTDLFGAIVLATFNLDFRCAHILLQALVAGLADECTFLVESKVFQHHRSREDLSQRIGEILAGCLRP